MPCAGRCRWRTLFHAKGQRRARGEAGPSLRQVPVEGPAIRRRGAECSETNTEAGTPAYRPAYRQLTETPIERENMPKPANKTKECDMTHDTCPPASAADEIPSGMPKDQGGKLGPLGNWCPQASRPQQAPPVKGANLRCSSCSSAVATCL